MKASTNSIRSSRFASSIASRNQTGASPLLAQRPGVRSMKGVVLEASTSLSEAAEADVVLGGSGMPKTREVVADATLMAQLKS